MGSLCDPRQRHLYVLSIYAAGRRRSRDVRSSCGYEGAKGNAAHRAVTSFPGGFDSHALLHFIGHTVSLGEQEIVQGAHKENVQVLTVSFKSDYLFATDSTTIMPGAQPEIQRVADVLRQYPETNIQIAGHTDSQGSEVYNQQLSERRAQAVRDALVGMGVDPGRITVIGYGESRPIASNDTASGRQHNRRVEVRIIPKAA